jgi:hypothetical protein
VLRCGAARTPGDPASVFQVFQGGGTGGRFIGGGAAARRRRRARERERERAREGEREVGSVGS